MTMTSSSLLDRAHDGAVSEPDQTDPAPKPQRRTFTAEYKNQNDGASPNASRFLNQLDDDSIAFQHAYIRANSHPLGSKHMLDTADEETDYG